MDVSRFKTPRALLELSIARALEHQALEQTLPGSSWRHPAAWLEWESAEPDRQRVPERVQRLRTWGYPAEWSHGERAQELERAVALPVDRETDEIALYREGRGMSRAPSLEL